MANVEQKRELQGAGQDGMASGRGGALTGAQLAAHWF